ncbi:MAG: hypothetical protein ABN482_13370 [Corticimicrobacter sp.]|uniref:hypothetical protein n=1 Tax=Corticimicrobacter sp. TaxID=2678536 RepID=UPI0032DB26B0
MEFKKIEIFGSSIEIPSAKINANLIRKDFNVLAINESDLILSNFYGRFSNLDDLYEQSDGLAHEVLSKAIDQAMKILASHEIYEVTEEQLYSRFAGAYVTWDEDFEPIAAQYETIAENTAELDAHRTARRQNRAKWVGFNQQAVYQADAKNLISNVGHGVFNLMAKGVTAIGNSIKKDEIFKNRETVSIVSDGVKNIINAVFLGTVDAINSFNPGVIYSYSSDEISKAAALVESIEKGRIPEEKILLNFLKAIEYYPYSQKIYTLIFQNFGGDNGKLNAIISYFGMRNLDSERKMLFDKRIKEANIYTIADFQHNIEILRGYASRIEYPEAEFELEKMLEELKEKDFTSEVAKYSLKTLVECDHNLPILEKYSKSINYDKFSSWASSVRGSLEVKQKQEEIKQQQQQQKEEEFAKKSKFMQFMTSDDPSTKKKRGFITLILLFLIYLLYKWNP